MTNTLENTDEENINPVENENYDIQDINDIPVISNVDDVVPITNEDLYILALESFRNEINNDIRCQARADIWYRMYFGENYTPDNVASSLEDDRQKNVITEYLLDRLAHFVKSSTSLDSEKIVKNIDRIFAMVGFNISTNQATDDSYDAIFEKRAANIGLLSQIYKALKINREVAEIYARNKNITNLSRLVTKMEDLASDIKPSSSNDRETSIIDNEIMAQFYYNISEVYDNTANSKNNMPEISKWEYRSILYKKKALDLTSQNIEMVSNIQNTWQYFGDYDPQKITDACERIIDNPYSDERSQYRANKLYADTKTNIKKVDTFNERHDRHIDAILHYRIAMQHTDSTENKLEILNSISKIQKLFPDKEEYIKTRLEISELMHGRPRIRERLKLTDYMKSDKLKEAVLKSCINEFQELDVIRIEDRRLYNSIDEKLRGLITKDDIKTLKILDTLKKRYGMPEKNETDFMILTMSSSGKDHFSK